MSDTRNPVLSGLVVPTSIDVRAGGGAFATFLAQASDDDSGVQYVQIQLSRAFRDGYTWVSSISINGDADSYADGSSLTQQFFSSNSGAGAYDIVSAYVVDKAGNLGYYDRAALNGLGVAASINVISDTPTDTIAPTLTGITLPSVIDVRSGGALSTFTVRATDMGGAGVDSVYLSLDRPLLTTFGPMQNFTFGSISDSFADGASSGQWSVTTAAGEGVYQITGATLYDKTGNYTYYSQEQLTALGVSTSFTVLSNSPADTVAPTLTSISLPSVDIQNGAAAAAFSVRAADAVSGVSEVTISFDRAIQTSNGLISQITFSDALDSFADGLSSLQRTISIGADTGPYNIAYASVTDKAGNYAYFTAGQLASMGLATSFNVLRGPVTPTVVVNAPTVVTEGNDTSFSISLTLKNVATATGTVETRFNGNQASVANLFSVIVPEATQSYTVAQAPARDYVLDLGAFQLGQDDLFAEPSGIIAIDVRAPGLVFDNGTDHTIVRIRLNDNDFIGAAGADTLTGSDAKDYLSGLQGNDILLGGGGQDRLFGNEGGDRLDGGAGADEMFGGVGNDFYLVDDAGDLVSELGGEGDDTVQAAISYTLGANVERLVLAGVASLAGTGNALANDITGNAGNNSLSGGDGDDVLRPLSGNDSVDGGAGSDTLVLAGARASYRLLSADGATYLIGSQGAVRATGVETVQFANATVAFDQAVAGAAPFDPLRYIASYRDLMAGFGANAEAGTRHFLSYGFAEGRQVSFDPLRYIASYADLTGAFGSNADAGVRHYLNWGANEGRTASFDALRYVASYSDLTRAFHTDGDAGLQHYLSWGFGEGRRASFDPLRYIASYGDLINAFGVNGDAGVRHYLNWGFDEGRRATFDPLRYIASYSDLTGAFGANADAGVRHYLNWGFGEGRQATFDPVGYLLSYGDLGRAGIGASGALNHWLLAGYREGRAGDSLFGREQASHAATVGGDVSGAIDRLGDRDWFEVQLHAGQQIELTLDGTGIDGSLAVHDSGGKRVAFADDGGPGPGDAHMAFTATADGLYYLVAASSTGTGTYHIEIGG